MLLNHPAEELIDTRSLRIMASLDQVETSMTGRQIARVINAGKSRTGLVLGNLTRIGVLTATPTGNTLAYVPNRNHFYWQIFDTIQSFQTQLQTKLIQLLPEQLHGYDKHAALFIFGSVARYESTSASDIDLGIIVPDDTTRLEVEQKINSHRQEIETFTGNDLNPFLVTWEQFTHMVENRDPLINSWAKDAQHLAGDHVFDLRSQILLDMGDKEDLYA